MSGVDPFLWTAGEVLADMDSSPIGGATGGQTYQASVRVNSHYNRK